MLMEYRKAIRIPITDEVYKMLGVKDTIDGFELGTRFMDVVNEKGFDFVNKGVSYFETFNTKYIDLVLAQKFENSKPETAFKSSAFLNTNEEAFFIPLFEHIGIEIEDKSILRKIEYLLPCEGQMEDVFDITESDWTQYYNGPAFEE